MLHSLTLMPGDVSLSAEDRHLPAAKLEVRPIAAKPDKKEEEPHQEHQDSEVDKSTAFKFLLAGGVAGASTFFLLLSPLLTVPKFREQRRLPSTGSKSFLRHVQ